MWACLFGELKLSKWKGWRKSKAPQKGIHLVTGIGSARGQDEEKTQAMENLAQTSGDEGYLQLVDDISHLIHKGRTDKDILAEMELGLHPEDAQDLVRYLRSRAEDGLPIV